jgi:hypothetical protein
LLQLSRERKPETYEEDFFDKRLRLLWKRVQMLGYWTALRLVSGYERAGEIGEIWES